MELRLKTARGLQFGRNEARRRYEQLARHYPHHLLGQGQYLQQVCPKWSGSYEMAHAFGQECLAAAPPGSFSPVIVAKDVTEHWSELPDGECTRYVRSTAVRAELLTAAEKSVFHASSERVPGWVAVMSTFACAFSLAGLRTEAGACFRALGPFADDWGWKYLNGCPDQAFSRYRAFGSPRVGVAGHAESGPLHAYAPSSRLPMPHRRHPAKRRRHRRSGSPCQCRHMDRRRGLATPPPQSVTPVAGVDSVLVRNDHPGMRRL